MNQYRPIIISVFLGLVRIEALDLFGINAKQICPLVMIFLIIGFIIFLVTTNKRNSS